LLEPTNPIGRRTLVLVQAEYRLRHGRVKPQLAEARVASRDNNLAMERQVIADEHALTNGKADGLSHNTSPSL
jgi:hypothetical protein